MDKPVPFELDPWVECDSHVAADGSLDEYPDPLYPDPLYPDPECESILLNGPEPFTTKWPDPLVTPEPGMDEFAKK